jgi:tetratricopeptide (TPR) repeat protein
VATAFSGDAGPDAVVPRRIFEEAIDHAERSGELWALAISAGFAGTSLSTFDPEAGAALLRRGVEAAHRSGSPSAIGAVTMAQGRALGRTGHTDEAVAAFDVAIRQFIELGDTRFALAGRSDMAHALRRGGRLDQAMAVYRETIGGWVHFGQKGAVADQLENIAYVQVERGRLDRAARLLGAAAAIRESSGARMSFDEVPERAAYLDRLRGALATEAFEAAWNAGLALPQADAVALALEEEPGSA